MVLQDQQIKDVADTNQYSDDESIDNKIKSTGEARELMLHPQVNKGKYFNHKTFDDKIL